MGIVLIYHKFEINTTRNIKIQESQESPFVIIVLKNNLPKKNSAQQV